MDCLNLKEEWLLEEMATFKGWDFSRLENRWQHESLPWDYDLIVKNHLKSNFKMLDMGTGGGEYLLELAHPFKLTCATEAYPPNFELCKNTLSPLGIEVRQVFDDSKIPFENEMFDIIINRHEAFDANEVARMLKPKGIFITQQVGGLNNKALSEFLTGDFKKLFNDDFNLINTIQMIKNCGFDILFSNEYMAKLKFFDVGAIVYYAKIIEWEFPEFDVEKCFSKLCELQKTLLEQGFIESIEHRFVIVARKNK